MVDLVLAVVAAAALAALGVAAVLAVTAAPFLVALAAADRSGVSTARVGAAALAGIALGTGLAWAAAGSPRISGPEEPLAALPLLLTWFVPLALGGTPRQHRWLGRAGRHERRRTGTSGGPVPEAAPAGP